MEEKMRTRLLIAAAVANVVILLSLWVGSCSKISQFQKARVKEMDIRLDREKQLADLEKKHAAAIEAMKQQYDGVTAELKATLDTMQKSLTQEQLMNASLKEELEKINKAKKALEDQLKDLVAKGAVSTSTKIKK